MNIDSLRKKYHADICRQILFVDTKKIPNIADASSKLSVRLAKGIVKHLKLPTARTKIKSQTAGKQFEVITCAFLERVFKEINHLRPGRFKFIIGKSIEQFEQYEHISVLNSMLKQDRILRSTLGDYLISPDIVISRDPLEDKEINVKNELVNERSTSSHTPLRKRNSQTDILHASISCKWTIRSDRSQNARTEGLNLIRNRKGHTPHIAIVTAEPYPPRIASLALGTGDIDCVYHFALHELVKAAKDIKNDAVIEMLDTMIEGKRLRDIADLPFDLAI